MFQKLTALLLFCLMTVASATAQAGPRYCLCFDTIYLGSCACELPSPDPEAPETCCHSCGEAAEKQTEDPDLAAFVPHHCSVELALHLEQFTFAHPQDLSKKSSDLDPAVVTPEHQAFKISSHRSPRQTRGPPPPLPATVPLFLRHSVFLV